MKRVDTDGSYRDCCKLVGVIAAAMVVVGSDSRDLAGIQDTNL